MYYEKSSPCSTKIRGLIHKDVCRTYNDLMDQNDWQSKAEYILAIIAEIYSDMGYCQGMSYIAGEIINVINSEEYAFWIFAALIEKYHLQFLYMNVIL